MSREFLNRNYQQNSDSNNNIEQQKKIDPQAQLDWINHQKVDQGWGLYSEFARMLNEERGDRSAQYEVPKGWDLKKIADHFDVSIESLKEKNKEKLKQWNGVEGFEAGEVIIIPPKEFKKKEAPKDPKKEIQSSYSFYKLGQYNMPDFVRSILPYVKNNEQEIIGIIEKLSKYERDNFSYSLAYNSDDSLLASLDAILLSKMANELDTIFSLRRESNLIQKDRIDKFIKKTEQSKSNEEIKEVALSKTACWDSKSNTVISKIHSKVKEKAFEFINTLDKKHSVKIRAYIGFRTFDEQNELYKKGRDEKNNIVDEEEIKTYAKGGQSFHNYGLAIDVVEIKENKALWNNPNWELIGKVGKELGFKWGGDWSKLIDKPHFEYTMGYSIEDLQKLKNKGKWEV